jgi:hypothetical protein
LRPRRSCLDRSFVSIDSAADAIQLSAGAADTVRVTESLGSVATRRVDPGFAQR